MSSSEDDSHEPSPQRTRATRSSKACDSCRKQKSKCERTTPSQPCKNCIIFSTPCTSLRPSRKRGPPKGYIDRLECALHQSEALIGIIMAAGSSFSPPPHDHPSVVDHRAESLLADIKLDPLARQILDRIDKSPYGVSGRHAPPTANTNKTAVTKVAGATVDDLEISSTHPSNEWQDKVLDLIKSQALKPPGPSTSTSTRPANMGADPAYVHPSEPRADRPVPASSVSVVDYDGRSPRQRRRVDEPHRLTDQSSASSQHGIFDYVPSSPSLGIQLLAESRILNGLTVRQRSSQSVPSEEPSSKGMVGNEFKDREEDPDWIGAIGQLSLNEDEEVRYHGRASGLHLLGHREREDGRNAGGIWRFPKARVWPPLSNASSPTKNAYHDLFLGPRSSFQEPQPRFMSLLPDVSTQQKLLDAFFTHVHPYFPIVLKHRFIEAWRHTIAQDGSIVPQIGVNSLFGHFNRDDRRRSIPLLLLLSIFSIAARHCTSPPTPPPSPGAPQSVHQIPSMWDAGDNYFEAAKTILDDSYTASCSTTCQALLLLAYREIGIGAMAQSWIYTGMAIRMAQDLGLHRAADGWTRAGLGGKIFPPDELQERKRIWYACVIMDKYVSSYIGRPLAIYERDFDTKLPDEIKAEEQEEITFPNAVGGESAPVINHIISCFNATATLSGILSRIIQIIYTVRPLLRRRTEAVFLEGVLDKWYFELTGHLRYEPRSNNRPTPPPHVLTLHMQYWCAVLLLHRPFMKHSAAQDLVNADGQDGELSSFVERSDDLSAGAATHISSLVSLYGENYDLSKGPVFLCYYIFTAGIMHVTTLTFHPQDPQAQIGISRCVDSLKKLEIVWPAAGRALVLLSGAKAHSGTPVYALSQSNANKRPADNSFDENATHYLGTPFYPHSNIDQPGSSSQRTEHEDLFFIPQAPSTHQFSGALSTSVLPQMYSTGLFDGRSRPSIDLSEIMGHNSVRQDQQYPEYWHDHSTFPQLTAGFGTYSQPQQHSSPTPSMYMGPQLGNSIFSDNSVN